MKVGANLLREISAFFHAYSRDKNVYKNERRRRRRSRKKQAKEARENFIFRIESVNKIFLKCITGIQHRR